MGMSAFFLSTFVLPTSHDSTRHHFTIGSFRPCFFAVAMAMS
jgi:hypothetical protein